MMLLSSRRACIHKTLARSISQGSPDIDLRSRLLQKDADSVQRSKSNSWSTKQMSLMSLGGGTASLGSGMILYSHASSIFTLDNIGFSMLCVGGAVAAWGSGQLSKTFGSERKKSSPKFSFHLLNERNKFSAEKKSIASLCGGGETKWPEEVKNMLEGLKSKDVQSFESDVVTRQQTLKDQLASSNPLTANEALSELNPKAFVINYMDPEPRGLTNRGRDTRSRAERFGEEVSLLLSCASRHDVVLINLTSPGGAVSEFGLAASHLLRLKSAGIRTVVTVDKVAASGGFMMACCADEIVAAPFAFLGSIGVIAEIPNVNKILKKQDVDWLMFTAGKFKRTVTVFGQNTEEGKIKFQSDLDHIHEAFKQHVGSNRGDRLDVDQVATGEAWLAVQCKEYGLVDRLGTSWDIIADLANEGRDVLLVERAETKSSPLQRLLERSEDAALGLKALVSNINAHVTSLAALSPLSASTPEDAAKLGSFHAASRARL